MEPLESKQDASDLIDDVLDQVDEGTYLLLSLAWLSEENVATASFGVVCYEDDYDATGDQCAVLHVISLALNGTHGGNLILTRLDGALGPVCCMWKLLNKEVSPMTHVEAYNTYTHIHGTVPLADVSTFAPAMEI